MGSQQVIMIIFVVILIAIAIAVGMKLFSSNQAEDNKEGITLKLMTIAQDAYQYKIRPTTLGGGGKNYSNFQVPSKLRKDDHGTYAVQSASTNSITLVGQSAINQNWVATCTADDTGKPVFSYSGW